MDILGHFSVPLVYRRQLAEITGERSTAAYRNFSGVVNLGRRLERVLGEVGDQRYVGDREIIDRWAEELGIEGWFYWHPFDEMPEGYEMGLG